jgi:hypothetical protein
MEFTELIPAIRSLPRADKLRLIQFIAADVAQEEETPSDLAGKTIPLWSPHDSFEGAATLLHMLEEDKG